MRIIILLGIHGSGKGEQMALLVKNGYVEDYISTGEAYAKYHDPGSRYHRYEADINPYEHYYAEGKYFPDELTIKIVRGELERFKKAGLGVIGMEGFPRNLDQLKMLEAAAKIVGGIELRFVYLVLSDGMALERLAGREEKRATDAVDGKRIALYHQVADPMIEYLRQKGLVKDVDDRPSIEEVHKLVVKALRLEKARVNKQS